MAMHIKRTLLAAISGLLLSSAVMAGAQTDFNKAMDLFRAGNYEAAVRLFEAARKQGVKSVSLYYNLGSVWYKLGHYEKSGYYFSIVAKNKSMRDLAEYNLGLIAMKYDDLDTAERYFLDVDKMSSDRKLRIMARRRLRDIAIEKQRWRAYISMNYGYDDNITAAPSDTVQGVSDNFYDLFASVDRVVGGRRKRGWIVDASYFRIDFADNDTYDEYLYGVGVAREQDLGQWNTRSHLSVNRSNYSDEDFQSIIKLDLKGYRSLSSRERLILRYRFEDINSDNAIYDYLQGWRQKARIEYRNYQSGYTGRLYYELELNDREDINLATYAASYSPVRQTLRGKYTHIFDPAWQLTTDLAYRTSDYPATFTQDRDDNRWQLALDVDYRFDKTSKLRLRMKHTDNESTIDVYDYDKNVVSIGFSKLF